MSGIRDAKGFSLIELMIVVAIMAILVALGFPLFSVFAKKAKATEAMSLMGHIRTMQESYRSINDTYLTLISNPPGDVPSSSQSWGNPGGNWDELGFETNEVRYQVSGAVGSTSNIASSFLLTAQSDLDINGAPYDTWTLDSSGIITHTDHYR